MPEECVCECVGSLMSTSVQLKNGDNHSKLSSERYRGVNGSTDKGIENVCEGRRERR